MTGFETKETKNKFFEDFWKYLFQNILFSKMFFESIDYISRHLPKLNGYVSGARFLHCSASCAKIAQRS